MYAEDLIPYFINKRDETTTITYPLHFIIFNLVNGYADNNMEVFNTRRVFYEDVVSEINYDFLGLKKGVKKRIVTEADLVRICFPKKDKWDEKKIMEGRMSVRKLSAIYLFFNKFHQENNNKQDGQYWIEKLEKNKLGDVNEATNIYSNYNLDLTGANLINSDFKNKVLATNQNFTPAEFYTAKQDHDCQWYGVAKDKPWDAKREKYDILKKTVLNSFKERTMIAAVICGTGGSGKTTVLRRLAIDFINCDFLTLWVTNLNEFSKNIGKIKSNSTYKFLLIIENWDNLRGNSDVNAFLYEVSSLNNIRIIIGDRVTTGKDYLDYFDEKRTFTLMSRDNEKIITKVLIINPTWRKAASNVLSKPEFYLSSLYLILFVIARVHAETAGETHLYKADILSQFKSIIRTDQNRIYKVYPGLIKALFYYSLYFNEHTIYNPKEVNITWEAFLILSDFYNGHTGNEIGRRFLQLEKNDQISEILSYYISLEHLAYPLSQETHIFHFHHNLLVEHGLSQKLSEDWCYNNNTRLQFLEILIATNQIISASTLYYNFHYTDFYKNNKKKDYFDSLFRYVPRVRELKINSYIIEAVFQDKMFTIGHTDWESTLWLFMCCFINSFADFDCFRIVLETLMEKGCTSKDIIDAYEALMIGNDYFVAKYGLRKG